MIKTLGLSALIGLLMVANSAAVVAGENTLMMVRHHVADYATWRAVFDEQDEAREASGLDNVRVYQGVNNANEVVILMDAADLDKAIAFASSAELKARMMNAGVKGKPDIVFLTVAP